MNSRTLSARKSTSRGKALETLVETANAMYLAKGKALLQKLHTGAVVGTGSIGFYKQKVWADFVGMIAPNYEMHGRAVLIECKARANYLYTEKKREPRKVFLWKLLEPHQAEACRKWKEYGGQAWIVLWTSDFMGRDGMYCFPYTDDELDTAHIAACSNVEIRKGVYDYLNLL